MKTHFILLCLIVSGVLANATIQNKTNLDKPPVVYVDQHIDSWAQYDTYWNGLHFNVGGSKNYTATIDDTGYLSYKADGTFFYHDEAGTSWFDSRYNWSDSNTTGTFSIISTNDEFDDVLNGTGYGDIFTPFPYSVPSVSLTSGGGGLSHFYANINYDWNQPDCVDATKMNYFRNTKTYLKLKTGGKVGINRQNLFGVSASATEYERPECIDWADAPDYWINAPATSIDPTRIRILGHNVGNDGNLFIVLPDNATLDLAASAPGKHYNLNVTATKHKLYVQANTSILQPDHVVPTGTFSVGQKLTFSYFFNPAVGGLADTGTQYQWLVGGFAVNGWNSLGHGYDDYFFDTDLLQAPQTTLWHYSDAVGKKATINLTLQFLNGQQVKVSKVGLYTVVKPTVNYSSTYSHYGAFWVNTNSLTVFNATLLSVESIWLSMGTSAGEDDGAMDFEGDVTSRFPGTINWLQLVNCTNESSFPILAVSTGGNLNLDGSLIYPKTSEDLIQYQSAKTIFYSNLSAFSDSPGILVGNNFTTMSSTFITFLRFQPSTPDSIPVTLGRVDWSWNAQASYDSQGQAILPVNQVTGPTFTLSNQFPPMWYDIKDNVSFVKDEFWYLFFGL